MRSYILTDVERKILTKYLMTGEVNDSFWVLLHRMNKAIETLDVDIELIHKTIEKYASK